MLESEVEALEKNPSVLAVFTRAYFINDAGKNTGLQEIAPALDKKEIYTYNEVLLTLLDSCRRNNNPFLSPSALLRTEVYRKLGSFRSETCGTASDLDMWLRVLKMGPVMVLKERLLRYRMGDRQGGYKYNYLRTDQEDFFNVLDQHIKNKPKDLVIGQRVMERYELRRSLDKFKRGINYLLLGDHISSKALLREYSSYPTLKAILRNLNCPMLLACWLLSKFILLLLNMGLGRYITGILHWYRYTWTNRGLR